MEISPEEKKRIYEEEKARIEAEKQAAEGESSTKLAPNKAGFLCYVGFWVTGIIFLIIGILEGWVWLSWLPRCRRHLYCRHRHFRDFLRHLVDTVGSPDVPDLSQSAI